VSKFPLDANLSVQTKAYLRDTFGFDVLHVKDLLPISSLDDAVLAAAKREQRVVITFDQDFGEIYYLRKRGQFGAIVLELEDQTVESVNRVLAHFFHREAAGIDLDHSLVVLETDRVRIVRPEH